MCETNGALNIQTEAVLDWLKCDAENHRIITAHAKQAVKDYDNLTLAAVNLANEIKTLVTVRWNEYALDDKQSAYVTLLKIAFKSVDWREIACQWIENVEQLTERIPL